MSRTNRITAAFFVLASGCGARSGLNGPELSLFDDIGSRDAVADGNTRTPDAVCTIRCDSVCVDPETDALHCGACSARCPSSANAIARCDQARCSFECRAGYARVADACVLVAPRPIAPLSTAVVTSLRPTLRWQLPPGVTGAHVEICRDRACMQPEVAFDAPENRARPTQALAPGVHYWRLSANDPGAPQATSVTWEFFVRRRDTAVDTSWGSIPDFDGNGRADLAIGASPSRGENGEAGAGRVDLYLAGTAGIGFSPDVTFLGSGNLGAEFGNAIASAGDLDGDGYPELAIAASRDDDSRGRVSLFRGGPRGPRASADVVLHGPPSRFINEQFGRVLVPGGDIDGDGYADLVVGEFDGQVTVIYGGPANFDRRDTVVMNGPGSLVFRFGETIASGDIDGDGFTDVVVGASDQDHFQGGIYVYAGSRDGLARTPTTTVRGTLGSMDQLGLTVVCGDFDGDGHADVAAASAGRVVHLFRGSVSGLSITRAMTIAPPIPGGYTFGFALANVGDLDDDGNTDLVVGEVLDRRSGRAWLYRGGDQGVLPMPVAELAAPAPPNDLFAVGTQSIAGLGDTDGDGFGDLVIGAPYADMTGQVYLYLGTTAGVRPMPSRVLVPMHPGIVGFGHSLGVGAP